MGKIIGIAMVGLTQFLMWVILTVAILFGLSTAFTTKYWYGRYKNAEMGQMGMQSPANMAEMAADIQQFAMACKAIMYSLSYCSLFYFWVVICYSHHCLQQ